MIKRTLIESPSQFSKDFDFCAEHILRAAADRSLGFCFGAGISQRATGCSWAGLVRECLRSVGKRGVGPDPTFRQLICGAERFKIAAGVGYRKLIASNLYREPERFREAVQRENSVLNFVRRAYLDRSQPFDAVTLNFDDFIEQNLQCRGEATCAQAGSMATGSGIRVLHAHGYLPLHDYLGTEELVFSSSEYKARISEKEPLDKYWFSTLLKYFESRFVILVGVGGGHDIWQLPVQLLNRIRADEGSERLAGIWVLFGDQRPDMVDRISALGYVPLLIPDVEHLDAFFNGLVKVTP